MTFTIADESPPYDVFISHSKGDKQTAVKICTTLEARGVRCWIAPRDIAPGKSWRTAIVEALDECQVIVLVRSAQSNDSKQVLKEVNLAEKGAGISYRFESRMFASPGTWSMP